MSSRRLPGKSLRALAGKPLLQYLVEVAQQCKESDAFLVATSTEASDQPIADLCEQRGWPLFRGSLENVAERLLRASEAFGLDAFVRLNGDSPLHDPRLVDRCARIFRQGDFDLVTNVFPRSFPKGQSVEVVSRQALAKALPEMNEADREHVTPYFYRNPHAFRIRNLASDEDLSSINLCVDTQEDLARIEAMIHELKNPPWQCELPELLSSYRRAGGEEAE